MTEKHKLTDVLPHKPPMLLIDEVISYNKENKSLVASFGVTPEKLFFDKTLNGINSLVGLEMMAQTIGCYSFYRNNNQKPEAGLLLGSRLYNNAVNCFKNGETYKVIVKEVYTDDPISSFDCMIRDKNGEEIQSAGINVCSVSSIEDITKNEN